VILEIDDKENEIGTMNRLKGWNSEKPDIP
jgi:hypothetical protein